MNKIRIFYDGDCGLCHHFVVFILRHKQDDVFIFSPQNGKTFSKLISQRMDIGDTIVVLSENDNSVYFKSKAVQIICIHLKWPWKGFYYLFYCIPTIFLNFGYDFIARIRQKLFKKPHGVCPVVPRNWMKYFED